MEDAALAGTETVEELCSAVERCILRGVFSVDCVLPSAAITAVLLGEILIAGGLSGNKSMICEEDSKRYEEGKK